jgi:transposase
MTQLTQTVPTLTIGLDVGDRTTHVCVLDADRKVVQRGHCATRRAEVLRTLAPYAGARLILEAGSQSPWLSAALRQHGFAVQVADPRRVALISKDPRKTDRRDAEMLARLGSGCPELLGQVHHRDEQTQADLSVLRARDLVVRTRTKVIQQVRGLLKAFGHRLPSTSSAAFARRVADRIPDLLQPAILPLLALLEHIEATIAGYDGQLAELARTRCPAAAVLQRVDGVGPVTSVAFALTVADPARFATSRQVGSWLGLCPASRASGDRAPDLPISKTGDGYLRRLLVQCAQYILGPFGKDSDLRRYGLRLKGRGGAGSTQRAAVAVARKLAVLLHRLWTSGDDYEPLRSATRAATVTAA